MKIYGYSHPTIYSELCNILVQSFSDTRERFHKFQDVVALRQHGEGLDAYMDKFMELCAQVPEMSPQDSLAIYLGSLEASVRIHLLVAQHVSTLELALEDTRIYANAHRGFGVRASGQYETVDDPMDLTVHMPVVRQGASERPWPRTSFGVKCFNCGRMGHMRDTCPVSRRAQSPLPAGGYGLHNPRQGLTSTDSFRPRNVGR